MRIDQDARDADGEMDALDTGVDLDASPAAAVNLPPVGTHDTSAIPELPEIDAAFMERFGLGGFSFAVLPPGAILS